MAKRIFTVQKDGFVGAYYGGPEDSKKAVILMLGDSSTDHMARFGAAIDFLKSLGMDKVGIAGASTTGMLALVAASYFSEKGMSMKSWLSAVLI